MKEIIKSIYGKLKQFTLRELVVLVTLLLIAGAIIFGQAEAKVQTLQYTVNHEPKQPQRFYLTVEMQDGSGTQYLWCQLYSPDGAYICAFSDKPPEAQ